MLIKWRKLHSLRQITIVSFLILPMLVVVAYADVSLVNQYDPNGNLVSGDGKYYEYNDANQLVRVRENDQSGKVIAEYFYDFTGQRAKKVENGVTTYYIGKHFETILVAGKAENTSYFFADGERVAKKVADSDGNVIGKSFYHPDHLGGVNAVTNAAGAVVAKTSYLPFGEVRQGGQEKYSYTGKEKDKATDLYYFDARFNSPELRHFTQADSADADLSDPQDLNRYAYVGNNPLSYVDPDGHKKKKKAKLSKREKWMIAHGVDPDHDKTSLKKAKKLEKEGKKYTVAAKAAPARSGQVGGGNSLAASNYADNGMCMNESRSVQKSITIRNNNINNNFYGEAWDLGVTALSETDIGSVVGVLKIGKFFVDDANYLLHGGEEPSAFEALKEVPFGIGFMIRSSEFFYNDAKYLSGKGPEPSASDVLKEAPGAGLVIKGISFFGKQLGEL